MSGAPLRQDADPVDAGDRAGEVVRKVGDVLLRLTTERDAELRAHADGVGSLVRAVAERLSMPPLERDIAARAGELHDIGKLTLPDEILLKPGPLEAWEREVVQQHPTRAGRILAGATELAAVAELVRCAQERLDGSGYPRGLRGDRIPYGARVVAACDMFDAMTSRRPWRGPLPMSTVLDALRGQSGTKLESDVVSALLEVAGGRR